MQSLSSFFSSLRAESGALRGVTGRDLQLRIDTARLYLLSSQPSLPPTAPGVTEEITLDDLPPFSKQLAAVSSTLTAEATSLILDASTGGLAPQATPAPPKSPVVAFTSARKPQRRSRTYALDVRASSIPGANQGLFIRGHAPAGTLLTLYPGTTYRPSDVRHMPDYPAVSKRNEYLMWRYDGIIVDGAEEAVARTGVGEALLRGYAAGQFANHGPPNALQFAVTIDRRRVKGARGLVPNIAWSASVDAVKVDWEEKEEFSYEEAEASARAKLAERGGFVARAMKNLEDMVVRQRVAGTADAGLSAGVPVEDAVASLGLVALRDIDDEEVFINYRFNPSTLLLPDWYEDCDVEESERRWVQEGFWN